MMQHQGSKRKEIEIINNTFTKLTDYKSDNFVQYSKDFDANKN